MTYGQAYCIVSMIAALLLCIAAWPTAWLVSIGVITFVGGLVGLWIETDD